MDDMSQFKGNSNKDRYTGGRPRPKPILSTPPKKVNQPAWSRLGGIFNAERLDVGPFVWLEIVVPRLRDLFVDVVTGGANRIAYGDGSTFQSSPHRQGGMRPPQTPYGRVTNTNRQRDVDPRQRHRQDSPGLTRRDRAAHDLSKFMFPTASSAQSILDWMYEELATHGQVSVADVYSAIGITPDFVDNDFGWTDLRGNSVRQSRDGFAIFLPPTIEL